MSNLKVHYMSEKNDWGTPREFMEFLEMYYRFRGLPWKPDLDAAASIRNTKAPRYYSIDDDSLNKPWEGNVWLNPPYGRTMMEWIDKCTEEFWVNKNARSIIALVPARTDTKWAHRAFGSCTYVKLIKGRFVFQGATGSAPFPSMLLIWGEVTVLGMEYKAPKISPLIVPKEYRVSSDNSSTTVSVEGWGTPC